MSLSRFKIWVGIFGFLVYLMSFFLFFFFLFSGFWISLHLLGVSWAVHTNWFSWLDIIFWIPTHNVFIIDNIIKHILLSD